MFLEADGINFYYEVTGSGPALILAHGNGEDHTVFDRLVPRLAEHFTVYAVDSPGHGKSRKPASYHYGGMANAFAALIEALGLERPAFCGFSDGGIIGLILAMERPNLLSKLTVCGANLTPGGLKAPWRLLYQAKHLFTRDPLHFLMLTEPQLTESDLKRIAVPTLVLAGERDVIKESETRTIAEAIPGAELQILPGETHDSYVVHSAKLLPFLTGTSN